VQIGHDGGSWSDILSDWDLEYVSIYVENMEEFYVFRNTEQQWVKKGNDLTLHREGKFLTRLLIYIRSIWHSLLRNIYYPILFCIPFLH
jgi:hypothetical protein